MVLCLNQVQLLGYVGSQKDIKIKHMNDKRRVAEFSLATKSGWKNKETGELQQDTQWHKVVIYSQALVDVVEKHIRQGSRVQIWGELNYSHWEGKDGSKRHSTEIVVKNPHGRLIIFDRLAEAEAA